MKISMVARMDNSGLGNLTWEFARHINPHKVLLVQNNVHQTFPERYDGFNMRHYKGPEDTDWLLEDSDVVFSAETFYDQSVIPKARKKGVKTVLYTMYEMTPDPMSYIPDALLCPSKIDYDTFKDYSTRVEYIPYPIATDRLVWQKRSRGETFVHSASHTGMNFRKGTKLFLDAVQYVESDVKFVVYTWKNTFFSTDPRVEIKLVNFRNYWNLWKTGDVLVYPQDYNGICLPVVEAMSSGLGVITTDIYPFNEYMPKDLLFKPKEMYETRASYGLLPVKAARIDPRSIAEKIDFAATHPLDEYSEYGLKYSKENSWDVLLPQYMNFFNSL